MLLSPEFYQSGQQHTEPPKSEWASLLHTFSTCCPSCTCWTLACLPMSRWSSNTSLPWGQVSSSALQPADPQLQELAAVLKHICLESLPFLPATGQGTASRQDSGLFPSVSPMPGIEQVSDKCLMTNKEWIRKSHRLDTYTYCNIIIWLDEMLGSLHLESLACNLNKTLKFEVSIFPLSNPSFWFNKEKKETELPAHFNLCIGNLPDPNPNITVPHQGPTQPQMGKWVPVIALALVEERVLAWRQVSFPQSRQSFPILVI